MVLYQVLFYLALAGVLYGVCAGEGWRVRWHWRSTVAVAGIAQIWGLAAIVFASCRWWYLPPLLACTSSKAAEWVSWGIVVAALAAGFMPWTKREGVVLLVAFCLGCCSPTCALVEPGLL